MQIDVGDIVGISEIAEVLGKSRQNVCNIIARNQDFPKAIKELKSGSLYNIKEIQTWFELRSEKAQVKEQFIGVLKDIKDVDKMKEIIKLTSKF